MARDERDFLARWSRLKREAATKPAAKPAPDVKPPELPAPDQLTPESDFKAFMHAKVEDGVRRAALKKLFADPRFNVIDVMDIYIDDYTKGETISPAMLADLEHSKSTLFGPRKDPEAKEQEADAQAPQLAEGAPPAEENRAGAPAATETARCAESGPLAPRGEQDKQKEDDASG